MIHYSIIPLESVMQEDNSIHDSYTTKIIQYKGRDVEVLRFSNGMSEVKRIFSTSLNDFLDFELQPGTVINNFDN